MVSIIIPTFNEGASIQSLVAFLNKNGGKDVEVIVADGDSNDDTAAKAKEAGAIVLQSPEKGRAAQMNYGASKSNGDILYFVHADSIPPETYVADIQTAVGEGYDLGRYRSKFISKKFLLKLNAFFTRFDLFMCYGGDQTFFITHELFNKVGGFAKDMKIMEDYEIVERAKLHGRYKIIPKVVAISARKYDTNSWFKVQRANYRIVKMYKNNASQDEMVNTYKRLLNYR